MKKLIALAIVFMTSTSYAIMIDSGNNMAQEQAPMRDNPSIMNDRRYTPPTYGSEVNDSISTGQSSTRRNSVDTPAANTRPVERCIDRRGYSYSRNDSGYAACVNQNSRQMRNR